MCLPLFTWIGKQIQFPKWYVSCLCGILDGAQSPKTQRFWALYTILRTLQILPWVLHGNSYTYMNRNGRNMLISWEIQKNSHNNIDHKCSGTKTVECVALRIRSISQSGAKEVSGLLQRRPKWDKSLIWNLQKWLKDRHKANYKKYDFTTLWLICRYVPQALQFFAHLSIDLQTYVSIPPLVST
jgi:hypothetical protein